MYEGIAQALEQASDKKMEAEEKMSLIQRARIAEEKAISEIGNLLQSFLGRPMTG